MNLAPVKTDMLLVVLDTHFDVNPPAKSGDVEAQISAHCFSLICCLISVIATFLLVVLIRLFVRKSEGEVQGINNPFRRDVKENGG